MKNFLTVHDVKDLDALVNLGLECKADPLKYKDLGKNKTLGLIFMNPSLRTRLATQKAAQNLGMNVMVMNFSGEGWALETEEGVIMDGDKAEHIKDAAAVVGEYCDVIGVRTFPKLKDRDQDYAEQTLGAFIKYAGKPVVSLEGSTLHPFQSLADMITIKETVKKKKPKVVLTWAPHPRALPQSVPNSFAQWMNAADVEFVIANPKGFNLKDEFVGSATVTHDQEEAFKGADVIYAKNWSSYENYGETCQDSSWMVTKEKMDLTDKGVFMHCLPVRRNVVVNDDVMDSDYNITIQEAGNRVWSAQAVLKSILEEIK